MNPCPSPPFCWTGESSASPTCLLLLLYYLFTSSYTLSYTLSAHPTVAKGIVLVTTYACFITSAFFSLFLNWTTLGKRTNGKGSYGTFVSFYARATDRGYLLLVVFSLGVCMKVPWCIGSRAFSVVCGLYVVGTPCVCFCSRLGSGRDKAGSLGFGRCGSLHLPSRGWEGGLY
jgi:hypothetical protein